MNSIFKMLGFAACLLLACGCPKTDENEPKEDPIPDLILPENLVSTELRCSQGAGFQASFKVYDALRFISTTEAKGGYLRKVNQTLKSYLWQTMR